MLGDIKRRTPTMRDLSDRNEIEMLDAEDKLRLAEHRAYDAFYLGLFAGMLLASAAIFGSWFLMVAILFTQSAT